jgi:hypothetical protein
MEFAFGFVLPKPRALERLDYHARGALPGKFGKRCVLNCLAWHGRHSEQRGKLVKGKVGRGPPSRDSTRQEGQHDVYPAYCCPVISLPEWTGKERSPGRGRADADRSLRLDFPPVYPVS